MRIAINVEQLFQPSPGGIGRYVSHLLEGVPDEVSNTEIIPFACRHSLVELAAFKAQSSLDPYQIRFGRWPRGLAYELWAQNRSFGSMPPVEDADVIHAPSVAVPPKAKQPLVVTVHDAAPFIYPETFTKRGVRFHLNGFKATTKRASVIVTVTETAKAEIAPHVGEVPIVVVHNAVVPKPTDKEVQKATLDHLGLDRPFILWVGSFEPRKNVGVIVDAMADLKSSGKKLNAKLVLAGHRGWLNQTMMDQHSVMTLGNDLVIAYELTEPQLWSLYANATLAVFPSLHEGFGLPPLEAMTQGCPTICSDIGSFRETMGDASVLVDPSNRTLWAEAIFEVMNNESRRQELTKAGIDCSAQFSLERFSASIRSVYESVI